MKIKQEHIEELERLIDEKARETGGSLAEYFKAYQDDGLSVVRFVHDVLRWACLSFVCDTLYQYLNDDNLTVAMKHILKKRGII